MLKHFAFKCFKNTKLHRRYNYLENVKHYDFLLFSYGVTVQVNLTNTKTMYSIN